MLFHTLREAHLVFIHGRKFEFIKVCEGYNYQFHCYKCVGEESFVRYILHNLLFRVQACRLFVVRRLDLFADR